MKVIDCSVIINRFLSGLQDIASWSPYPKSLSKSKISCHHWKYLIYLMYFYSHYIRKLFKTIFQREAKYEQTKLQILYILYHQRTWWTQYQLWQGGITNILVIYTIISKHLPLIQVEVPLLYFFLPFLAALHPPSPVWVMGSRLSTSVTCTFVTSSIIFTNICIRRLSDQ